MAIRKIVSRSLGDGTVNKQELDVSSSGAGTGAAILPSGTTEQRPGSAAEGMLRYNSTTGLYEQYTATGWQAVDAPPTVSSISPSTFNGESGTTITLTGTGFKSGATVKFISNGGTEYTATTTTFVSSTSVTATTPQDFTVADEPFDVKIINSSGLAGTLENALDCGGSPTFTTASGTLGTIYDSARSSYSLSTAAATDPDAGGSIASYAITSGAVPTGMSFNTSTAAITGTPDAVGSDTTSNFTITATDNAGNTNSRAFSILVKAPVITSYTTVGSGTFSVPSGISAVQVLVVAGGGAGGGGTTGAGSGGGGGAGGVLIHPSFPVTPGGTVSYTLGGGGSANRSFPGSATGDTRGSSGSNSVFGSLTAVGGGGGGGGNDPGTGGRPGGSGGGASPAPNKGHPAGSGTQPSQSNPGATQYGNPGGTGGGNATGGPGGGAGGPAGTFSDPGGAGVSISITGSPVYYGGGGGSGMWSTNGGMPGGTGNPSGAGGNSSSWPSGYGQGGDGTTNRGGGGGGGSENSNPQGYAGNGGPGIIIVKY